MKRQCWQPALKRRTPTPQTAPPPPSTARVVATLAVASHGGVEEVTTRGDPPGYPGLSACLAAKIRTWKFPESSGPTTVNVPFVFARE